MSLALDWYPNSNHVGLFIAQEKGLFRGRGSGSQHVHPGRPLHGAADRGCRVRRLRHQLPARRTAGAWTGSAGGLGYSDSATSTELGHDVDRVGHFHAKRPGGQEDRVPGHPHKRAVTGHDAEGGRRARVGGRRAGKRGFRPGASVDRQAC